MLIPSVGPVFLSYRHQDGTTIVEKAARLLRSHGVPVWLDQSDLPPGDIEQSLLEALGSGLSDGILVATPGVAESFVIKNQEVPGLLAHSADSDFRFVIINGHKLPSGEYDFEGPRVSLGWPKKRWGNPKQYRAEDSELVGLAGDMARLRIKRARQSADGDACVVELQTRRTSHSKTVEGHLVFRSCSPADGQRVLPTVVWEDLRAFTAILPQLVEESKCGTVEFRGGSHLSVGFAAGAALPEASGFGLRIVDRSGTWTRKALTPGAIDALGPECPGRAPAIFIDVNPNDPPEDTFGNYLAASAPQLCRHEIAQRVQLDAGQGSELSARIAWQIRQIASAHKSQQVHLFLRTPWPMAILVGSLLNTLSCHLYEWNNAVVPAAYVPSIVVASGVGGGPIQSIS